SFRFEVEGVRFDEELLFVPSDVVPPIDLDTHLVLMQVLKLYDEKAGRESRPLPRIVAPPAAPAVLPRRVDVVTRDAYLYAHVAKPIGGAVPVAAASWGDAAAALIVADLRDGDPGPLARLRGERPDAAIIAILADDAGPGEALRAGATSATPVDA